MRPPTNVSVKVVAGLGLVSAVLFAARPAVAAPDSLTASRAEVTDRALSATASLGQFQAAVRAAEALTRGPLLPRSPVLEVELEGAPSPFSSREYTRRVGLEQEMDWFGQGGARRRVGRATVAVTERELASRQQAIQAAVDETYGRWLVSRHRLEFLTPLVDRAREMSLHAEQARRREIITGFDVRVLNGDVAEVEAERTEALRDFEQAEAELRVWLGMAPETPLRLIDDLDRRAWPCAFDSLMALAQRSRADLGRAAAAESLASARVGLERRLSIGNPTLAISAGRERRSFESPLTGDLEDQSTIVGVHATVPLPLVRAPFAVNEALVELGRAHAERAALVLTIRQEIAAACVGLGHAEERRRILETIAAGAAGDLRLTESAYREGRIPLEQYLTVRERLVRVQREAIDSVAEVEDARTRLVRATGVRRDALVRILGSWER